jgi:hypothetical protein
MATGHPIAQSGRSGQVRHDVADRSVPLARDDLALVIHDGYPPTRDDDDIADRIELPSWTLAPNEGDVELRVHNRCAKDLRVVLGGDPSVRSGTPSTLPAHAALRYFAPKGTPLWLVDEAYRPQASTSLRRDTVDVAPTCDAFTAG